MNHFDPETIVDERRQVASHYYPLAGPYDSGDPAIIEYHLLLMKLAGIDGIIVDWYGLTDLHDYATLHRNTKAVVQQVERMNMRFVICYEDQTVSPLIKAGRITVAQSTEHVAKEIDWMVRNWFSRPSYVRIGDRPVMLSFGNVGLSGEQWTACLKSLRTPIAYFSEHTRRVGAVGAFDWPIPNQGLGRMQRFEKASADWPHVIPAAYPRFVDVYSHAKVSKGYVRIEDNTGKTFRRTLEHAFSLNTKIVQVVTWNDWGEGTCIEPSREFGYRDLEAVQDLRRSRSELVIAAGADDLRLPLLLLQQRRQIPGLKQTQQLDEIADQISAGDLAAARAALVEIAMGGSAAE